VPSPTRGYIRGIRQVYRRLSGQDHFAASALPDSGPVLVEITDRVHPPMRVPDPTLRLAEIHVRREALGSPAGELARAIRARCGACDVRSSLVYTGLTPTRATAPERRISTSAEVLRCDLSDTTPTWRSASSCQADPIPCTCRRLSTRGKRVPGHRGNLGGHDDECALCAAANGIVFLVRCARWPLAARRLHSRSVRPRRNHGARPCRALPAWIYQTEVPAGLPASITGRRLDLRAHERTAESTAGDGVAAAVTGIGRPRRDRGFGM
jgi:hypothetical protein